MTAAPSPHTGEIARLSVEIDDVTPRVVRVVEVPLDIRLDDLHFVLQIAIGWQNGHPFEFRVGDKAWGLVDRDAETNPLPAEGRRRSPICARSAARSGTATCSARTGSTRSVSSRAPWRSRT